MANEYFDFAKVVTKKEDLVFDYLDSIDTGVKVLNEAFLLSEVNRMGIMPDIIYKAMLTKLLQGIEGAEEAVTEGGEE